MGDHRSETSATPTTRCCPRRWRRGRCRCSASCCRATSRSSTRSIARFLDEVRRAVPGRRGAGARACRSSTRRAASACGWRIWPSSAATRSTASRRCTPSCSRDRVLKRLPRAVAGAVQQRDQRRDAATLAGADQPAARAAASTTRSATAGWRTSRPSSRGSSRYADDAAFQREWRAVKRANKARLAGLRARDAPASSVDPDSLFDVQVKRHPRVQAAAPERAAHHHAVPPAQANPTPRDPAADFIFGGKAAPGYFMAKLIIKLINAVAETVNNGPGRQPAT